MLAENTGMGAQTLQTDVLIVGAGISGISMAAHMKMLCPGHSFTIAEARGALGGTWDLFRYPGVRSDSDMHTLGFVFEPWVDDKAIADGPAILDYLNAVVDGRGIAPNIAFGTKIIAADWVSQSAQWHITLENAQGRQQMRCKFLYLGAGYYDYENPHEAAFKDTEKFDGRIIQPQFWPDDLDYSGKQVVVIGSGASAVTIVPAMAQDAAHVTMVQRTPTWMSSGPSQDRFANLLRMFLPGKLAYWITRKKNIALHSYFFRKARGQPAKAAAYLTGKARQALGKHYDPAHFLPPYPPWDQRLCLVPDGDFFNAVKSGKASIITDRISRFDAGGIWLESGRHLPADIIVTATGLKISLGGKIALAINGKRINLADHWFYRGCMFSNIPNFASVFGYLNASWTLRADNDANYICRLLNTMKMNGSDVATPFLPAGHTLQETEKIPFSSGYLQRARALIPKSAPALPWRLNQDYQEDCRDFKRRPIDDGVIRFETVATDQKLA